jgi:hypothetical protein
MAQSERDMADPNAALLTQLRNIQSRTGRSIAELHAVITDSGLAKAGERRTLLMQRFQLGYGDANTVALMYGKPLPPLEPGAVIASVPAGDALAAIYAGPKAPLRALHDAVIAIVRTFGPFEEAPKKAYISLRRSKQFAMVGPATRTAIEIGLNAKTLSGSARLKAMPAGGMCAYTVRVSAPAEIDAELAGWLRTAYDAAA